MATTRHVALLFSPQRLGQPERELLAGVRRFAQRHPHWRCHWATAERLPDPCHGILAPGRTRAADLRARGVAPTVFLTWQDAETGPCTRVAEDRALAGRLAAAHLHHRGYRSFAYVGRLQAPASRVESAAYEQWLSAVGRTAECHTPSRQPADLAEWLRSLDPPVGIFCADDALARTLAALAPTVGLRVPDDVGLIGGGNDPALCELGAPTLSSIDHHYGRVGTRGSELLERLMGGEAASTADVLLEPAVVPRESTDRHHVADPIVARALHFIEAHSAERIRVAEVAEAAGLGERQLERRMRERRGRSVGQEILEARLERARLLLETSREPLAAIARRCGLGTRRHLARVFRQHLGTTPSAYRARHSLLPPQVGH